MFAGWRGKRKEVQVLQPPTLGPGPGSGLPAFGPVFFQPEIPVEPQSGQGKTKYQPAAHRVVSLIATVCCQVWAWGQPDERHAASPHQQTMQVTSKGRKKKKKAPVRELDDHTMSQRRSLQSALYSGKLKGVRVPKRKEKKLCFAVFRLSDL